MSDKADHKSVPSKPVLSKSRIELTILRTVDVQLENGSINFFNYVLRGDEDAAEAIVAVLDETTARIGKWPDDELDSQKLKLDLEAKIGAILDAKLRAEYGIRFWPFRKKPMRITGIEVARFQIASGYRDALIKLHFDPLKDALAKAKDLPPVGSVWLHKKTNGIYRVTGAVLHEKEVGLEVAYVALVDPLPFPWTRAIGEFNDGRYTRLDDATLEPLP